MAMACAHPLARMFLCCRCTVAGDRRRAAVSQQGVLPVIHLNSRSYREIVCVRYEAMWWCRGIAPLVPNLGTGGDV